MCPGEIHMVYHLTYFEDELGLSASDIYMHGIDISHS